MHLFLRNPTTALRLSLVFVWLWTGAVSLIEWHGQSTALMRTANMTPAAWDGWLIGGGAALDLVIGLAMLLWPTRLVYVAALIAMLGMTIMATVLLPDLWLHPLGPLSKNLPIAAALWWLASSSGNQHNPS